jgi:protein SCO1/2
MLVLLMCGTATGALDEDAALARSQGAIGQALGDYQLTDRNGQPVALHDLLDRPTVVSLIYTSCYHTCPVTTRHLAESSRAAREALGEDSFRVITIGFDTGNDDPDAMAHFARQQKVDDDNWHFLSSNAETMSALVDELGFSFQPSPHGFDHLTQATVVQAGGEIYGQVYGELFELPWLVEPLKQLVFGQPVAGGHMLSGLLGRVKLFCTVYDPTSGRYTFDYSLFIQITIGLMVVLTVLGYLIIEAVRARRRRTS